MQDINLAVRSLSKTCGFSIAAVLMLFFGIGASTAIFSVSRACCCVLCHFLILPARLASEAPRKFHTMLVSSYAISAVLLSALEIYSIIAFSVA